MCPSQTYYCPGWFFFCFKSLFSGGVRKHTARIASYWEERHFFMKFFDTKAFVIMAVMMTGGITLRFSGWAPEVFIAVFYTGLGASFLLAGVLFGRNYGRAAMASWRTESKGE